MIRTPCPPGQHSRLITIQPNVLAALPFILALRLAQALFWPAVTLASARLLFGPGFLYSSACAACFLWGFDAVRQWRARNLTPLTEITRTSRVARTVP